MPAIPYIQTSSTDLGRVRPRHREIMRRLVCGQNQREIARDMSLNEGRLSIIINSPLFQVELKKMERDVRERAIESIGDVSARIAKLQGPALDVLERIVTNPKNEDISLKLRKDTSVTVLELAGVKKNKNDEGMSDFAQFISEAYAEAKQHALDRLNEGLEEEVRAHALESGEIIDISAVESEEEKEDEELIRAERLEPSSAENILALTPRDQIQTQTQITEPSSLAPAPASALIPIKGNGNGNGNGNGHGKLNGSGSTSASTDGDLESLILRALKQDGIKVENLRELLKAN